MIYKNEENKIIMTSSWTPAAWTIFDHIIYALNKYNEPMGLYYKNYQARIKLDVKNSTGRFVIAAFEYQKTKYCFNIRTGGNEQVFARLTSLYGDFIQIKNDGNKLPFQLYLQLTADIDILSDNIDKVADIILASRNYYDSI